MPEKELPVTKEWNNYMADAWNDPMKHFTECPISEVRQICLKSLQDVGMITSDIANWAESIIPGLVGKQDALATEFVRWYLSKSIKMHIAIRAVRFVIEKSDLPDFKSSKLVCDRIFDEKHPMIQYYSSMPFLKEYLSNLIDNINRSKKGGSISYGEFLWECAVRAIRIVAAANDLSFMGKIEKAIELHESQAVVPDEKNFSDYSDLFVPGSLLASHIAILKSAYYGMRIRNMTKEVSSKR